MRVQVYIRLKMLESTMECGSFELHQSLTGNGHTLTDNPHNFSLSKPWPILPSYLPWSLNPNVPFRSCESYFGNGFTRRIDLLKSSLSHHQTGGWFRCFYSETLRSSICEGGRVRMHPDKIRMSIGGERLEAVMGRGEDEELPVFESGAFDVEVVDRSSHGRKLVDDEFLNQYVQFGANSQHTMRGLVDSVKLVGASDFQCSEILLGRGLYSYAFPAHDSYAFTKNGRGFDTWVEEVLTDSSFKQILKSASMNGAIVASTGLNVKREPS
ncbi:unnamed protein product [Camellia sinensis]